MVVRIELDPLSITPVSLDLVSESAAPGQRVLEPVGDLLLHHC
jgi:hypothetical protein